MAWNEAVITDAGIALLGKTFTEGNIVLTRAVGGESYIETERLTQQTEIEPPTHEMGLAGIKTEQGRITVKIHGQNTSVDTRYTLRQIGIFAKEKGAGGGDILFAIIQDEKGELIPALAENPKFLIEFDFVIPVSNAENIEVKISSSLFALQVGAEQMITRRDIVIPHENWNVQPDGSLYIDIAVKDAAEDMTPIVSIFPDSLAVAKACGISTACETLESQFNPQQPCRQGLLRLRLHKACEVLLFRWCGYSKCQGLRWQQGLQRRHHVQRCQD